MPYHHNRGRQQNEPTMDSEALLQSIAQLVLQSRGGSRASSVARSEGSYGTHIDDDDEDSDSEHHMGVRQFVDPKRAPDEEKKINEKKARKQTQKQDQKQVVQVGGGQNGKNVTVVIQNGSKTNGRKKKKKPDWKRFVEGCTMKRGMDNKRYWVKQTDRFQLARDMMVANTQKDVVLKDVSRYGDRLDSTGWSKLHTVIVSALNDPTNHFLFEGFGGLVDILTMYFYCCDATLSQTWKTNVAPYTDEKNTITTKSPALQGFKLGNYGKKNNKTLCDFAIFTKVGGKILQFIDVSYHVAQLEAFQEDKDGNISSLGKQNFIQTWVRIEKGDPSKESEVREVDKKDKPLRRSERIKQQNEKKGKTTSDGETPMQQDTEFHAKASSAPVETKW